MAFYGPRGSEKNNKKNTKSKSFLSNCKGETKFLHQPWEDPPDTVQDPVLELKFQGSIYLLC